MCKFLIKQVTHTRRQEKFSKIENGGTPSVSDKEIKWRKKPHTNEISKSWNPSMLSIILLIKDSLFYGGIPNDKELRPLGSKCSPFSRALRFPFWPGGFIRYDWVLYLRLYICAMPSSFSQRLWLVSFMIFWGEDLFPDLILWKGQPEIPKKLWPWQIKPWVISSSQRKYQHLMAKAKSRPHLVAIVNAKGTFERDLGFRLPSEAPVAVMMQIQNSGNFSFSLEPLWPIRRP